MPLYMPVTTVKYSNASIPGGNTIANTASETAFTSQYTIPANSLKPGDSFEINYWGVYSAGLTQSLTARLKAGATTLLNSGSLNGVANGVNLPWVGRVGLLCLSTGVSGSIDAQAALSFSTAATAAIAANVGNANPITIDTTIDQILSLTIQWGAANAANSITMRQMRVN